MSDNDTNSGAFIKLHDVYKSFGTAPVLRGISMEIAKGEVVCIIGPSGSGKSTVLRCINALTPVDQGFIEVAGIQVTSKKLDMVALCHKVSMVFSAIQSVPAPNRPSKRHDGAHPGA
jgi:polar amino acid transport system ATP-binding protein